MKFIYLYWGKYTDFKQMKIIAVCTQLKAVEKKSKPEKNAGLNGIRTHDLYDASAAALPTELSSQLGLVVCEFVIYPFMEKMWYEYMNSYICTAENTFKQMKIIAVMYTSAV